MVTYTVNLTPALRNLGSEGSLDTAVVNGLSVQRSVNMVMTVDGSARKMVVKAADGASFDDAVQTLCDVLPVTCD
jgi:hypothetical protein